MKMLRTYLIALLLGPSMMMAQNIPHMDGSGDNETRGDEYFEQMAYVKALDFYEKALEKSPKDKGIQLKIAKCYKELNNQEEVSYYSAQSVSHNSSTPEDILSYAESLSATENYDKADRMYSRYASLNSGDGRVERKKEALGRIDNYYADSAAYFLREATFNSERADFSTAFMGDDVVFVSNRGKAKFFQVVDQRDETFFLDFYKVAGDGAERLEDMNNTLHEGPMSFFDDGNKVIITTNRPEAKKNKERGVAVKLQLVVYEKGEDGWEEAEEFPHNSSSYSVGHPSFDTSSSTLYFASDMPGGKGGVDIYSVSYNEGSWGSPVNLGGEVNTEGDEVFPFVTNDELFFSSNGHGGLGGLDIFRAPKSGESYSTLGYPINTPKDDFGIALDEKGRSGYMSSNREGGTGGDDIYEITIYRMKLKAKVVDQESGKPVGGNLTIIDKTTGEEVPFTMEGDEAIFDAMRGRTYVITSDDEYYEGSSALVTPDSKEEEVRVTAPMERTKSPVEIAGTDASFIKVENLSNPTFYKLGSDALELVKEEDVTKEGLVIIEDVYFKFNSDEISKGVAEIDKVVAILKSYEDVEVALTAYCDARGSKKYNEKLAEKRAQRVEDYMTSNGVDADRIRAINIGEAELYNDCTKCNEEQHQQNRRVEFVLKMMQ